MLGFGNGLDRIDKLVLLLGFLVTIKVRIVGMFSVAELLLLFLVFFNNCRSYRQNKYVRRLHKLAIIWVIGTAISNYYNDIDQIDFIKGIFFLIVLILIIPPIYELIYEKPERLVLFFLGYGFGQLLAPYTMLEDNISERLLSDVYFFYALASLFSGVAYYLYLKGYRNFALYFRYLIAVVGLFNMARNPFLMCCIAFLLILLIKKDSDYEVNDAIYVFRQKVPRYFCIAFLALIIADSIYEPLAANGTLGKEAQKKYLKQKISGGNVLEGGRRETFMGIQLIAEKPMWGYGSYAKDRKNAFHKRYAAEHKIEYKNVSTKDKLLPSHSHIVGAWMQNGICGGLFWIYVFYMCWKIFMSGCIMCEPRMLCLLMFQSCSFLWDICFSPFGDRALTMFFLITLFVIYDRLKKGDYENELVQKLDI